MPGRAVRVAVLTGAATMAALAAPIGAQGGGYSVAGRVVDKVSGTPLARVVLLLEPVPEAGARGQRTFDRIQGSGRGGAANQPLGGRGGGGQPGPVPSESAVTGADGSFRFAGVPEGRYQLAGSRRGYLSANLEEQGGFFAAVVTGPGHAETETIRFALAPEAEIRGQVLDSSGDPVENASITLFRRAFDGTGRVLPVRTEGVEPGSSRYSFSGLAPDTYYVGASGRPWWAEGSIVLGGNAVDGEGGPNPLDVAYATEFFAGASSAEQAEPITVTAGETVEANLAMQAVPAVHVQIPIEPGKPFSQLQTPAFGGVLPSASGQMNFMRREGDQTLAELSVAPGSYRLGEGEGTAITVTDSLTLPEQTQPQPVAVTGKVGMADGSALPQGTHVALVPDAAVGNGFVRFGRGGRGGRGFGRREVDLAVTADGTLHADAVEPGSYTLQATLPGATSTAVMGVAAQGAVVAGAKVMVGADPVMLAATVAEADGTVSGRIASTGAGSVSGVMVLLVPQDGTQVDLYRQDESNLDGSFSFLAVPAGQYRVLAVRDGWGMAWKDAAVLAKYLVGAEPVTVTGNGVVPLSREVAAQPR